MSEDEAVRIDDELRATLALVPELEAMAIRCHERYCALEKAGASRYGAASSAISVLVARAQVDLYALAFALESYVTPESGAARKALDE